MKGMKKFFAGAFALGLIATTVGTAHGQDSPGQSLDDPSGRSTVAALSFSTTLNGGTAATVSDHGNIIGFESPTGYEHIGVGAFSDGYVLCYTDPAGVPQVAYDVGASESAWGATSISGNTITRTTADGVLRLVQTFAFNGGNRAVNVTMKLVNLRSTRVTDVVLRRQTDIDTDTGGANGWAAFGNSNWTNGADSVIGSNDTSSAPAGRTAHAIALRHSSETTGVTHTSFVTAAILDTSCSPTAAVTPEAGTDRGATIRYTRPTLGASSSLTVKVILERV